MARAKERKLNIVIKAKDAFSSTFSKASSLAKSTGSAITKSFKVSAIAIAGTTTALVGAQAAITALVSSVAAADDKIGKMASRIGATTEALSEYQHVAELSGITTQTLGTAWQRQARRISDAAKGTGEAVKALDALGLSAETLNELKPEDQFEAIAVAMDEVSNQGDKMSIAMKIWDTEGVSLLQTMEGGADGLKSMREEAKLLGLSMSGEQAQAAADYNDEMTRLTATFSGFTRQIAHELMPEMTASIKGFREGITEFLPEIRSAITTGATILMNLPEIAQLAADEIAAAFKRTLSDPVVFNNMIDNFGVVAKSLVNFTISATASMISIVGKVSSIIWAPIYEAFGVVIGNISTTFSNFINNFKFKFLGGVKEADKATEVFSDGWKRAGLTIIDQFSGIGEELGNIGDSFKSHMTVLADSAGDAADSPGMQRLAAKINSLSAKTEKVKGSLSDTVLAAGGAGAAGDVSMEDNDAFLSFQSFQTFWAQEQAAREAQDEWKRQQSQGFFDYQTDLERRRIQIQEAATQKGIELSNAELDAFTINAYKRGAAQTAAAGISGAANKAMETQLLSLVDTGNFSAEEFGRAVKKQVKAELLGISARAAVNAIFYTGQGFAALAGYQSGSASNYFAAASQMAIISGSALVGAAAVNQIGGTDSTPTEDATTTAGTATTTPIDQSTATAPSTQLTIQINNPLGTEDWTKIATEEIIPAINAAAANNVTIDSTAIAPA